LLDTIPKVYLVLVRRFNDLLQHNDQFGGVVQVAIAKSDVSEFLPFQSLSPERSSVPVFDLLGPVQNIAEELSMEIEGEQGHVLVLVSAPRCRQQSSTRRCRGTTNIDPIESNLGLIVCTTQENFNTRGFFDPS
jgi:hypothetical protein